MFCKSHKCLVLVYGILTLASLFDGSSVCADDKKDNKDKAALSGQWVRKEGEIKIVFDGKGVMKIFPHGDNFKFAIVCEYTAEKDKRVKFKVTDFEGEEKQIEKVKEHIPVGFELTFKWTFKDKTATLDEIKGKDEDLGHWKTLEGEYERK